MDEPRELAWLADELGFSSIRMCMAFLEMLAKVGAIDAECLSRKEVFDVSVFEHQQAYQVRSRANRKNGSQPKRKGSPDE